MNNTQYTDSDLRFDLVTADRSDSDDISSNASSAPITQRPMSPPIHRPSPTPSDTSSVISVGDSDDNDMGDAPQTSNAYRQANRDINNKAEFEEKRRILTKIKRYETRRGIKIDKSISMYSSLTELRVELELIQKEAKMESAIDYSKRAITMCAVGIEILNKRYDPLDIYLDGWSASVDESIDDYDEILEELYDKYYTSVSAAPEVKLILGLVMSGIMYNVSHKMLNPKNSTFLSKLAKDHMDGPSGGLAESILKGGDDKLEFN
jgi:hypothetical protein